MSKYQLHYSGTIVIEHIPTLDKDGLPVLWQRQIPIDPSNWAYIIYQAWLDDGNIPDPADPAPPPDLQYAVDKDTMGSLTAQYTTLKNGMDTINTHMDAILAGPASPTATQAGTALKTIAQDMKTTMTGLGMVLDTIAIFARRGG